MQDFFLDRFPLAVKDELIANQIKVLDVCIRKHIPIIALEYMAGGVDRGRITSKLRGKMKNVSGEILLKKNNSGFTDTNLDGILKGLGTRKILMMGVNANGCVQDTAIGALRRGYEVISSEGLIGNVYRKDLELSKKNRKWFEDNTAFFDSPSELLSHVSSP
jgi:nicotinamidase-related amidase